jgi:cytochrome c biogenesis protein CcmG, thiol:disulfide interchange protein DsbE
MEQSPPTPRPKQPLTVTSCLAILLVLTMIVASLWAFWMLFTRVIAPMIPQRFVPHPEVHAGVGNQLTFLELEPLTGHPPRLSTGDLLDHVVLLNFWATWCPPCRNELPHIAELQKRFAGQQAFRLVAISYPQLGQGDDLQSLREETASLLKRLKLDLPTYCDPDDMTRAAVDQVIGFEGFPTTVLLDRYGVIRAVWSGYRPGVETEIERYVDKILSETDDQQEPQ